MHVERAGTRASIRVSTSVGGGDGWSILHIGGGAKLPYISERLRTVLGHPLWILRTLSYHIYQGRPRTVLGHPLWDLPNIQPPYISRTSQDRPGTSVVGSSGH